MRRYLFVIAVLAAGCGGSSPLRPSPGAGVAAGAPIVDAIVSGTLRTTNGDALVRGATVTLDATAATAVTDEDGAFSLTYPVTAAPLTLTIDGAGLLTRRTAIPFAGMRVVDLDVIQQDGGFDLEFYRQFVRNGSAGRNEPLRRLLQSPSIYLQRTGLSDRLVADLEQAARITVPALTGGTLSVAAWETGEEVRPPRRGWIVVELRADESATCGRAMIGLAAGHIWMNTVHRCGHQGNRIGSPSLFAHEIGHALGFWDTDSGLMHTPIAAGQMATERERYHAAIAYRRPIGNMDPDIDPHGAVNLAPLVIH